MADVLRKTKQDAASSRRMEEDLERHSGREETREDLGLHAGREEKVKAKVQSLPPPPPKAKVQASSHATEREPVMDAPRPPRPAPAKPALPTASALEDAIARMGTNFSASPAPDDNAIIFDT